MNTPNRWRTPRRCLLGLGILLTLICLFYTVERWRGKRAWEQCKQSMLAQGAPRHWADCIPAPVPDDQNFFGVPQMQQWFTGHGSSDLSKKLSFPDPAKTNRLTIAELKIGLPGDLPPDGAVVFQLDDPALRTNVFALLTNILGPVFTVPQGFALMLRRPEDIRAAQIFLQCKTAPSLKELQQSLSGDIIGMFFSYPPNPLVLETTAPGLYRATITTPATASDYLDFCKSLDPDFDIIRKAMQRPYAQMQGEYSEPAKIPIPYFITIRNFAQTLGARAQCHLLLGQPEEALRDLTLLHDSFRPLLEENKPMTLVSAMINEAVRGLYADQIADGLRSHAWREPQLAALEEQLKQINLLLPVEKAFKQGQLFLWHEVETKNQAQLAKLCFLDYNEKTNSWHYRMVSTLAALIPSGWIYQNIAVSTTLESKLTSCLNVADKTVFPDVAQTLNQEQTNLLSRWSPYTFIASKAIPNFTKACQSTAQNQTRVNQALIACALERYRLAHGEYPETLAALTPQLIDKIPHDVIGGQPPLYHRTASNAFLLYSIGWTGKDNGGVPDKNSANGDWLWPNQK
jgi:hypothetical protein